MGGWAQGCEEEKAALQEEMGLQREQLLRVGAVAERAASRETLAGPKPSGTIPLTQHLAEVTCPGSSFLHVNARSERAVSLVSVLDMEWALSGRLADVT